MKTSDDIKSFFKSSNGVLTIGEIKNAGYNYYQLNKLIANHLVERINAGVYRWVESSGNELIEISKLIPIGTTCLFTAAAYHELSTFISSYYHLAIPRKKKVTLPSYPPIKIYYWSKAQLNLGKIFIENKHRNAVLIYDKEKTVCDFIKFRNKVGVDLTKEVLQNYLNGPDRNISKLMAYAKELKIITVLKKYLEVLL